MSSPRVDVSEAFPKANQAMYHLHNTVLNSGLEEKLLNLVFLRASQINGCAYCLDMHTLDALATGETPQRLTLLDAWREAGIYDERERAALLLTEQVTKVSETHVPDEVYDEVVGVLGEEDFAKVVMAITLINAWNRIAISSRMQPGQYTPAAG